MEEFQFNMNNNVKVKLNDIGRAELKRLHNEIYSDLKIDREYVEQSIDDDGYSTFQMHTLMSAFGHMMLMGVKPPFETLTIRIQKPLLKPVK